MTYIMTIALTPYHNLEELLKIFLAKDKPAYPISLKKLHVWHAPNLDGKIRRFSLFECPEDKLYEGITGIMKRYNYYAQLEGYAFEVFPLIDEADAMKIAQG